ncbi:TetR/AcrR family transcriptional regulator [Streptomyces sp. NPDC091292]|uniref:TetR/AcrR family transcriptional regulator n=1 Tax=Streptomyces sp. NPDC091292 TaxID=3365991 RepID=UPI003829C7AD
MLTRQEVKRKSVGDPRVARSRAGLQAALRELIKEKELQQISVADIAKRAGMARSTFYDHFTDIDTLAASACTEYFDALMAAAPTLGLYVTDLPEPHEDTLPPLFAHVAEHARLYRTLLGPDGSARVLNHLRERMTVAIHVSRHHSADAPGTHAHDPGTVPHDVDSAFIAGGILSVVVDWLLRGTPGSPEQMATVAWPVLVRSAGGE